MVFPSTVHTWKSLRGVQSLQGPDDSDVDEYVFTSFERMYAAFDRDRPLVDPANFFELRYEDLVRDISGSLHAMYDHLRLGDFEAVRAQFEHFETESGGYRTNRYDISADLKNKIARRWKTQIHRWGYTGDTR